MGKENKNIGIDLDLTLIETHLIKTVSEMLGYTQYTQEDVLDWDFTNFPEDFRKKVWEYFNDPLYMCERATPIFGTQETIKKWVKNGHNIVVITARNEPIREGTVKLVNNLYPEVKGVYFVNHDQRKTALLESLGIDVWIDDAPHGVIDALDMGIETHMVSNKHTKNNWHVRKDERLASTVKVISRIPGWNMDDLKSIDFMKAKHEANSLLYKMILPLLMSNDIQGIDGFIERFLSKDFGIQLHVSLLMVTYIFRQDLKLRGKLFLSAKMKVDAAYKEKDAKRILKGLE